MMRSNFIVFLLATLLLTACRIDKPKTPISKDTEGSTTPDVHLKAEAVIHPAKDFKELFTAVQTAAIFPDSKTFPDCLPKTTTDEIMEAFETIDLGSKTELESFVETWFEKPKQYATDFNSIEGRPIAEHISALWPILTRNPETQSRGSLLPLPHSYVVPGGRFGEVYYWDSYFTMLGLAKSDQWSLIENMIDNFAHLIDTYGHIPNGNRAYYLSRSQPPFFALMIELLSTHKGDSVRTEYLPQLVKEYEFWMDGREKLTEQANTHRRVVRLDKESVLNRYYDDSEDPRPEAYKEDIATAAAQDSKSDQEMFRELRAGAESGWDYSSRWLEDEKTLSTIRTTEIIPVDLNALLYQLEKTISDGFASEGKGEQAEHYIQLATKRKIAIDTYCWNEEEAFYADYIFTKKEKSPTLSAATLYPLFVEISTAEKASRVAKTVQERLLAPGGLRSTVNNTGQQWDAPNGWAPHQWIAVKGLHNYEQKELARTIGLNWLNNVQRVYKNTGKLVEKYNVMDLSLEAGGGEYPVQDGFGWTNGVHLALNEMFK